MLSERHLYAGLDAICRAFPTPTWTWEHFSDGHRGAGMLAAYFMAQERLVDDGGAQAIARLIDAEWTQRPIFAPMPDEPSTPGDLERLLAGLWSCFGTGAHAGHHVIFPSFALKVFRSHPHTITRSRIDGLLRLATAYTPPATVSVPAVDSSYQAQSYCSWLLQEFLQATEGEGIRKHGGNGHLLTFGCAVMELHELGYTGLARRAEHGLLDYLTAIPDQPSSPGTLATLPVRVLHLDQAPFWQGQHAGILEKSIGHRIKYGYGFNQLMARVPDEALRQRCRQRIFSIFPTT